MTGNRKGAYSRGITVSAWKLAVTFLTLVTAWHRQWS